MRTWCGRCRRSRLTAPTQTPAHLLQPRKSGWTWGNGASDAKAPLTGRRCACWVALARAVQAMQVDDLPESEGDVGAVLTKEPITQTKIDQARRRPSLRSPRPRHTAVEQPGGAAAVPVLVGAYCRAYAGWRRRRMPNVSYDKDDATVKAIQKSIDMLTAKYAAASAPPRMAPLTGRHQRRPAA